MLENLNGAFHILDQYIKHPRGWFVQAGMSNLHKVFELAHIYTFFFSLRMEKDDQNVYTAFK